jgi:hypothetical protein
VVDLIGHSGPKNFPASLIATRAPWVRPRTNAIIQLTAFFFGKTDQQVKQSTGSRFGFTVFLFVAWIVDDFRCGPQERVLFSL